MVVELLKLVRTFILILKKRQKPLFIEPTVSP
jgi:hypothetical protein